MNRHINGKINNLNDIEDYRKNAFYILNLPYNSSRLNTVKIASRIQKIKQNY